jgi:hypothetical protein
VLPSTDWKRRKYKRADLQRWYSGETISLGIGQGYNNFTMLQLASATATLVAGGQRFKPRVVREIENVVTRERKRVVSAQRWNAAGLQARTCRGDPPGDVRGHAGRHFHPRLSRCAPTKAVARPAPPRPLMSRSRQNEKYNAAKLLRAPARPFALQARRRRLRLCRRRRRLRPRHRSGTGGCPCRSGLRLAIGLLLVLAGMGLVAMYSSGFDHGTRFVDHGRNMLLAAGILFVVAQVPPQR